MFCDEALDGVLLARRVLFDETGQSLLIGGVGQVFVVDIVIVIISCLSLSLSPTLVSTSG